MTTLTTIDLDSLAAVTGGVAMCPCMQQQPDGDPGAGAQPSTQPPASGAAPTGGSGGGGFLSFISSVLDFLKSPTFGHIVNGASELVTAFNGSGSQPQGDAGTQQA